MAAVKRGVKHAVFSYVDPDGVYRTALRGESVTVDGEELARGERFDVFFADDEEVAPRSPLDGALVGDDEVLDGEIGEVDLVAAVAAMDPETRAALSAALASAEAGAGSSPGGAAPTPLDQAALEAGATDELDSTGTVDGSDGEKPPKTANKDIWLAYRGLDDLPEEQQKDITKDQLQDDAFMASYQRPAPTT